MKKIAVYGAGAVGGLIAARLASIGCEVSAVARGATLDALRSHGIRIEEAGAIQNFPIRAVQDPAEIGAQDLVVIALKATALPAIGARIAPLVGPHTLVLTAMNGVPWWYFDPASVPYAGTRIPALEGCRELAEVIPSAQVIGGVVHLSASCPEPGLVRLAFGNRLIVGEPGGGEAGNISSRVMALSALLQRAGFDAQASSDIRTDIWYKLWGNMTMNPVSALTGATCDAILDDPLVRRLCLAAMQEAADIGARIGCPIDQSGEDRMNVARKLGAFKTSMLQDVEAGKALEIDALVTAVHEIGELVGVPTPNVDGLLGLVRLFARTRGLYPA